MISSKYHGVWCPKHRCPELIDGVDGCTKKILYGVAKELMAEFIELEVMPDRAQLLCEVDPQFGIQRLKGCRLRQELRWLRSRNLWLWTNWYLVSRVGGAQYIEPQKSV